MKEQGLTKPHWIFNPERGLPKRLFTLPEASVYLGRTVHALREMLWAGKMPYIKDGRRILLDLKDMDEWVEKNKMQFGA